MCSIIPSHVMYKPYLEYILRDNFKNISMQKHYFSMMWSYIKETFEEHFITLVLGSNWNICDIFSKKQLIFFSLSVPRLHHTWKHFSKKVRMWQLKRPFFPFTQQQQLEIPQEPISCKANQALFWSQVCYINYHAFFIAYVFLYLL